MLLLLDDFVDPIESWMKPVLRDADLQTCQSSALNFKDEKYGVPLMTYRSWMTERPTYCWMQLTISLF